MQVNKGGRGYDIDMLTRMIHGKSSFSTNTLHYRPSYCLYIVGIEQLVKKPSLTFYEDKEMSAFTLRFLISKMSIGFHFVDVFDEQNSETV